MEQLYAEVLYKILHSVGADASGSEEFTDVFNYLQTAFGFDKDAHRRLLQKASTREPPSVILSAEVQQGRVFTPTRINGPSDLFCVLYLSSSVNHKQNTTIQAETLNPVWNEKFLLCIENLTHDVLHLEVWDCDPEQTLQEKLMKIKHVKNYKTIKKLVKEVTGKSTNELIGQCIIPLKDIPAAGNSMCCKLKKPEKNRDVGELELRLSFGSETDSQSAFEQYKHLLHVLLLHELHLQENSLSERLSPIAEKVLTQYSSHCGLSPSAVKLAKWLEYIELEHCVDIFVLSSLLQNLVVPLQEQLFDKTKQKQFWESSKKLVPRCLSAIKNIPKNCYDTLETSIVFVKTLSILDSLKQSQCDLVLMNESESDIRTIVINTIEEELSARCLELMQMEDVPDEEDRLRNLLEITNCMAVSLEYASKHLDLPFQRFFKYPYALSAYRIYSEKFVEIGMPIVTEIFKTTQPIKFNDPSISGILDNDPLSLGNLLWEVYLGLKRITRLGKSLSDEREVEVPLQDFHTWFYRGVIQWLYIAQYKSLNYVQQYVERDDLISETKHCASAETLTNLLREVKNFLKLLDWPVCEDTYTFTAKVVDDMHECLLFYADNIIAKAETLTSEESPFRINTKWCNAINGILYAQHHLTYTVDDLELGKIIAGIATATDSCNEIVQSILQNSNASINSKISSTITWAANKITPEMKRILKECAKGQDLQPLITYLDTSLRTCYDLLRTEHFTFLLSRIWDHVITVVIDIMQQGIRLGSPTIHYCNLQYILKSMAAFLEQEESYQKQQQLNEQLALYALDTDHLIYQYYLDCLQEQKNLTTDTSGSLTVKLMFLEDIIKIELLHGYNLPSLCPKRNLNPYVKVQLVPQNWFKGQQTKSEPFKGTQHPLFQKQFVMHLDPKQLANGKGLVRFEVKHANSHGISWANRFVGEAFVPIADIPSAKPGVTFKNLPYIHLKLKSQPFVDSDAFRVLETKQDSLAIEFVKSRNQLFQSNAVKPSFRLYVKNENSLYTVYNSSACASSPRH